VNVIIPQCQIVPEFLATKDETLLIDWDAFFVLNLGFDVSNTAAGLDFERDSFASEHFHVDQLFAEVGVRGKEVNIEKKRW
jgi:hypothetical protein